MSIECAFFGFLASDAELRTSKAGKPWVRMRVGVGKDDAVQWVSVALFGKAVDAAAELRKSDRVYIEGSIKLDSWQSNDGAERHGLSVAAFKCERTHQIGRNRPKRANSEKSESQISISDAAPDTAAPGSPSNARAATGFHNDDIPF